MNSLSVPRLDSLLHRLQHAPGAEESSYLDQLMVFLEDPPPGVTDRWKQGALMCSDWGIPSTGASVWRLYRAHVLEWRWRIAQEAALDAGEPPEALAARMAHMLALRSFDVLADPQLSPASLIGVARLELQKQALELAYQKHEVRETDKVKVGLEALEKQVHQNREAAFAYKKMKEALERKPKPDLLATVCTL